MASVNKLMDLNGKTCLITGATGGLGFHIALTIAELGGELILSDIHKSDYTLLLKKLNNFNCKFKIINCDLENIDERSNLINEIKKNYHNINILVNNAAFVGSSNLDGWIADFEEQSTRTWRSLTL